MHDVRGGDVTSVAVMDGEMLMRRDGGEESGSPDLTVFQGDPIVDRTFEPVPDGPIVAEPRVETGPRAGERGTDTDMRRTRRTTSGDGEPEAETPPEGLEGLEVAFSRVSRRLNGFLDRLLAPLVPGEDTIQTARQQAGSDEEGD